MFYSQNASSHHHISGTGTSTAPTVRDHHSLSLNPDRHDVLRFTVEIQTNLSFWESRKERRAREQEKERGREGSVERKRERSLYPE